VVVSSRGSGSSRSSSISSSNSSSSSSSSSSSEAQVFGNGFSFSRQYLRDLSFSVGWLYVYKQHVLVRSRTLCCGRKVSMFQRNLLFPSSGSRFSALKREAVGYSATLTPICQITSHHNPKYSLVSINS
jgi:hypothetical protein